MVDFKALRKACAECRKADYWRCRECEIYQALNQKCSFCDELEAFPLIITTGKGLRKVFVCGKCHRILV